MKNMAVEKMKVVIDGHTIEFTVMDDKDMPDLKNDPCLKRKLEEAKAFLRKHPHRWMSSENAIFDDKE